MLYSACAVARGMRAFWPNRRTRRDAERAFFVLIQRDQTGCGVVQGCDDAFSVPGAEQAGISPLITNQSLAEPVLPVEYITDIDLEPRQPDGVAGRRKDFA